jgi:hypothetical protein
MPPCLEPKLDILPAAQKAIWTSLAPAADLNFVLCCGTAIALHLGHCESLDFDFFRSDSLDKDQIRAKFDFVRGAFWPDVKPIGGLAGSRSRGQRRDDQK